MRKGINGVSQKYCCHDLIQTFLVACEEVRAVVARIAENRLTPVTAIHDVIDCTLVFEPKLARHKVKV